MPQPQQMIPVMPSYPPTNITTEQIQKICSKASLKSDYPVYPELPIYGAILSSYLDENKKLILAILDNQNLGKLAECAQ
ncbi:hypothetical protein Godav_006378 [Gossypium davidsonii]|uniref:SS18 N-terminal domain-containing protein n=1 Tax=Gossypium davidsonii TaxID=34287 RepID=A0A7J8S488_GOSDV|nr:hypothetical protein [Gossypium davidsonii]